MIWHDVHSAHQALYVPHVDKLVLVEEGPLLAAEDHCDVQELVRGVEVGPELLRHHPQLGGVEAVVRVTLYRSKP